LLHPEPPGLFHPDVKDVFKSVPLGPCHPELDPTFDPDFQPLLSQIGFVLANHPPVLLPLPTKFGFIQIAGFEFPSPVLHPDFHPPPLPTPPPPPLGCQGT
jgi:hypothetical protein